MRRVLLSVMMLVLFSGWVLAEDVSVEATVQSNQLTIGDAGQLTLTIHGIKGGIEPPPLPKIDGIDTNYLGPSTSISIINGQYSSIHAYNYSIFPTKTGQVQIPPLTVVIDGKSYVTGPIDLVISDAAPSSPTAANPIAGDTSVSLKDKIFMVVSTPQANVYLGQKVPIRIKLYINQLPIRNLQFPKFEQNGFTMDNFAQPPQYNEVVNGVQHTVVDYQTFIYPTRPGELNIGPIQISGSLLYRTKGANPLGGKGFFNDDFFNGMFDSYQERPIMVNASAMKINVHQLPTEGKPADFTGAVGQMNFFVTINPYEVHVGDPITLRMKLSGDANFRSLHMPEFVDKNFKTYDPVIKDVDNSRIVEQVIIPSSEEIKQVPAIVFNYFDPIAGQYKTITQGPFGLKVSPVAKDQEFKAVGFADLSKGSVTKGVVQIDYVKKYIIDPVRSLIKLSRKWQFRAGVLIMGVFAVVLWLLTRFNDKMQTDTAFARRHRAFKTARMGIKTASGHLNAGLPKDFYHVLVRTMNNYLADKLHRPAASLTVSDILVLLKDKGVSVIVIDSMKAVYENADMVQFASVHVDQSRMQEDLLKVQSIIVDLEKKL